MSQDSGGGGNEYTAQFIQAERKATELLNQIVDEVNDFIASGNCLAVRELRDTVLMRELGRTTPLSDDDDEFFRSLSSIYTKILVECASRQWHIGATLREAYKSAA